IRSFFLFQIKEADLSFFLRIEEADLFFFLRIGEADLCKSSLGFLGFL
ncbi:10365_t:CDS:2, partial [Funneliformis caledonium]